MCDVDVVMKFCNVVVAVKTLVEEHQAVKNKTLIAPGKLLHALDDGGESCRVLCVM
jgi:hypothetical protein